ncbi:hypothetical protein HK096_005891 [Nowakowskiella sp. JEL0078]|nr:hypothetical protein HK096_005891 [Nowakowskiella sp. JEL0078]
MKSTFFITLAFYSLVEAQTGISPPTIPASFPPIDQTNPIDGTFLQDPIVVNAMKLVNATVPANILAIPPSTFVSGNVTYNSDVATNCYWPKTQCLRSAAGSWGKVDISTCPGTGVWGMTFGK